MAGLFTGTTLIHLGLSILGCIPGIGIVANLADAAVYAYIDHDYFAASMAALDCVTMGAAGMCSLLKTGSMLGKLSKCISIAGDLVSNTMNFATMGVNWLDNKWNSLDDKQKATAIVCAVAGVTLVAGGIALGSYIKHKKLGNIEGGNAAHDLVQYEKLKEYYRQAEKYGTGSIRELDDGRIRFYEKLKPASKPGEMAGARHVREWDPNTGAKRDWYETLDHYGNIRQVRPDPNLTGGIKVHYMFDAIGEYIGKWSPE